MSQKPGRMLTRFVEILVITPVCKNAREDIYIYSLTIHFAPE